MTPGRDSVQKRNGDFTDNALAMAKPRVLYWFRTDLRLHDSPALRAALDLEPDVLWPIFTWDPHYVYRARGGLNRWQFL